MTKSKMQMFNSILFFMILFYYNILIYKMCLLSADYSYVFKQTFGVTPMEYKLNAAISETSEKQEYLQ